MILAAGAAAAGDPQAGAKRAKSCAPCHGQDGIGKQALYPNLAGQKEEYLRKQLWAFKRGVRKDPNMLIQVRQLSGQDVDDLAAYYSSLQCRPEQAGPGE